MSEGTFQDRLRGRDGFTPNHVEFGQHIRSAIAGRPARQFARKVANRANATAPFAPKRGKARRRKHLKGSYETKPAQLTLPANGRRNRRASAIVYSDAVAARPREQGTSTQKPDRPLLKAAHVIAARELPGGVDFSAGD